MENLKIRVANEAESREAQELFFKLGYSWNHRKGYYAIKYPNIIRSHSTGEMTQSLDSDVLYKKNREITLPELRYMVAFKKESLNDKVASAEAYRQAEALPFIDDEPLTNAEKYPHYFKSVKHLDEVDVYAVMDLFDVQNQAVGHAVKKLLVGGKRGAKNYLQDIIEARDTLNRAIQILENKNG